MAADREVEVERRVQADPDDREDGMNDSAAMTLGHEPTRLDDAQALQAAAEHIEGRYPGMARLMRRCATRLYQSRECAVCGCPEEAHPGFLAIGPCGAYQPTITGNLPERINRAARVSGLG